MFWRRYVTLLYFNLEPLIDFEKYVNVRLRKDFDLERIKCKFYTHTHRVIV